MLKLYRVHQTCLLPGEQEVADGWTNGGAWQQIS